ncbi:MAG TPA: hypothetical protein VMG55_21630 [Stellaceae bacterium]|nr:hypothetical protein [Stellaceae bacterium]
MSEPTPPESDPCSEHPSFLKWLLDWDALADGWLYAPAAAIGIGVAFLAANWGIGMLAGISAYVVLAIAYAVLARIYGWRPLRWEAFFMALTGW